MKKRRQKTKAELVMEWQMARIDRNVILGQRLAMMIDILIMNDVYEWSTEEIENHLDYMQKFLESYNAGNEDVGKLIDSIKENLGIDVLGGIE